MKYVKLIREKRLVEVDVLIEYEVDDNFNEDDWEEYIAINRPRGKELSVELVKEDVLWT